MSALSTLLIAAILPVELSQGEIVGNVRVQFLTPSVVRLEQRGAKGFEDRPTFTVVGRPRPLKAEKTVWADGTTSLRNGALRVLIPAKLDGLTGIRVLEAGGTTIFTGAKELPANTYLPSPSPQSLSWAMADTPRLVPPKWGATPQPKSGDSPTSGWDTTNDAPDIYIFSGSFADIREDFLSLTGKVAMPPLYSLGFWESRYFAYSDRSALETVEKYRSKGFPLDVFVVDTDWRVGSSHGYGVNKELFPEMKRFIERAHKSGVRLIYNDHPEPVTATALDPKEMLYRWDGLTSLLEMGADAWWFDRNWHTHLHEPLGLPKEVWGAAIFHDTTKRFRPDTRPMIMSNVHGIDNGKRRKAPHPASHRFPIWWTGDTAAHWSFLRYGVENAVDSGTVAMLPYVSEDLGGHNGTPTPEIYSRFLQFGALSPITRVHCSRGLTRYPWDFGAEAEQIAKEYIKLRYRLMPTLYSAARRAFEDGTPLLRRCDLEWPQHQEAHRNDQYLLGDDILVAPIISGKDLEPVSILKDLFRTSDGRLGLHAEYFANSDLSGTPKTVKVDPQVQFEWGDGSPEGLPKDRFSVRWTGRIGPIPASGNYQFVTESDDGVRLWVDGKLLIDRWTPMGRTQLMDSLQLEAAKSYDVKLEYYELTGEAVCQLKWLPPDLPRRQSAGRAAWIPPGNWIDAWSGESLRGPRLIDVESPIWHTPMWLRQGGIILTMPNVDRLDKATWPTVVVEVVAPEAGSVVRTLYEDDGNSNSYIEAGFAKTPIKVSRVSGGLTVEIGATKGAFPGLVRRRQWIVRVRLPRGERVASVELDGEEVSFKRLSAAPSRPTGLADLPLRGAGSAGGHKGGIVVEVELSASSVAKAQKLVIGTDS